MAIWELINIPSASNTCELCSGIGKKQLLSEATEKNSWKTGKPIMPSWQTDGSTEREINMLIFLMAAKGKSERKNKP